jgi:hypothetical protein
MLTVIFCYIMHMGVCNCSVQEASIDSDDRGRFYSGSAQEVRMKPGSIVVVLSDTSDEPLALQNTPVAEIPNCRRNATTQKSKKRSKEYAVQSFWLGQCVEIAQSKSSDGDREIRVQWYNAYTEFGTYRYNCHSYRIMTEIKHKVICCSIFDQDKHTISKNLAFELCILVRRFTFGII